MKYGVRRLLLPALLTTWLLGCHDSTLSPDSTPEDIKAPPSSSAPVGLEACFTMEPDRPQVSEGETVTLDAACSERVTAEASYQWDLGDGRSRSGRRVQVQYRQPGDYVIRLVVQDRGVQSQADKELHVNAAETHALDACFEWQRIRLIANTLPCSVAFDASCSEGNIVEYRWLFSGPPGFPDAHRTTTGPGIDYSWATDIECMYFRPFDRLVQLTVVDAGGGTATFEDLVHFDSPTLRRPN